MSTLKVLHEITLFDDTTSSNDPNQARIKYKLNQEEDLSGDFRYDATIPASDNTDINFPSGTYDWLYLVTDQEIYVRLNGLTTNEVSVKPSVAGTKDGLFIKRGNLTSLTITVPGTTDAKVYILVGRV